MKMGTWKKYEDRPNCVICGVPCDEQNKLPSGKIIWRKKCYDCHDHTTDQEYLASKFEGNTLPFSEIESFARFN